jgi:hypothetical protein
VTRFTAVLIIALSLYNLAAAQDRQTIAVYMAGDEPQGAMGVHKVMGGELARTISQSAKYSAVDRTDAIIRQLSSEHQFQRSGAVSDEQIKNLGKQFGVQYLCIADISLVGGRSYYLDVRLVDVVTAEIQRTITAGSSLKNVNEMMQVAQKIAFELIETEKVKEQLQQKETKREQTKKTAFYTAIGFDVLGAGLLAYGVYENINVKKHVDNKRFPEAERSENIRNTVFIVGGAFVLAGISIHILF